jgi:hypothetical protein
MQRFKNTNANEDQDFLDREISLVEGKMKNLGYLVEENIKADHLLKL